MSKKQQSEKKAKTVKTPVKTAAKKTQKRETVASLSSKLKKVQEQLDECSRSRKEQENYNTATNGDIESLRDRINYLSITLTVITTAVAIAFALVFMTGCEGHKTTRQKCHDLVSHVNSEMSKCGADDSMYGYPLTVEDVCPSSVDYTNVDCDAFYECIELGSKCLKDGTIGSDELLCPPCKVRHP